MVAFTTIIAGLAAALGVAGVAVAVQHLIQPASIFVAFLAGGLAYLYLNGFVKGVFNSVWQEETVQVLAAVLVGVLVYRVFAWVLLALGGLSALVVIAVLLIGGTQLLVALTGRLAGELV